MEKQTQEIVEEVIAITVEYGVDIVGAIVLLILGWTIAGWARRSVRHALERVPRLDETLKPFLAKLVWYVVMVFVLVAVLSQFGVQTTSLIAVLGAAGLAIGLALQGTLANVSSGVMLPFLRPFNIGDYIDTGGIAGELFASTISGSIRADADALERVELKTLSGSIRLRARLLESVRAHLKSFSGGIEIELPARAIPILEIAS